MLRVTYTKTNHFEVCIVVTLTRHVNWHGCQPTERWRKEAATAPGLDHAFALNQVLRSVMPEQRELPPCCKRTADWLRPDSGPETRTRTNPGEARRADSRKQRPWNRSGASPPPHPKIPYAKDGQILQKIYTQNLKRKTGKNTTRRYNILNNMSRT